MSNVVKAVFSGSRSIITGPRYQYDYGQILLISGVELPESYEVHFSNAEVGGEAVTQIGGADGVNIPDSLLTTGKPVYAWLFLHDGQTDGRTAYTIKIPVTRRSAPSDDAPAPVDQSAITQAIAALNAAVTASEASATEASGAASEAAESTSAASEAASEAHTSEANAAASAQAAAASEAAARTSEESAAGSAQAASDSAASAMASADRAEQAADNAGYMDIHIDEDGYLVYTRTDAVDVDFTIDGDGYLVMETI